MPKRLYDTTAWRRASRAHLARHPLCTYCEARGRIAAANAVDHVVPHRGDRALFWARDNWTSACVTCHNAKSASNE